jgi:ABC-2 type transport system permease protein
MTAMAALGTMIAVISAGARIAAERSAGWTRQLRITPLTASAYFRAKVLCGYLMAVLTIAVMCLAGTALGVRLPVAGWLTMTGLLLVGLVPFAVLGVMLGHLLGTDSLAPAVGGVTTLFALLGGAYGFQLASSGALFDVIKGLPSYWLVQAGKTALGGGSWPAEGWIVVAVWTAVLAPLAVSVYRRDTGRA